MKCLSSYNVTTNIFNLKVNLIKGLQQEITVDIMLQYSAVIHQHESLLLVSNDVIL